MSIVPSPLDAFKPIAGKAIEAALNRLVALDPDMLQAFAAMEGRRMQLSVEAPALSLEVSVRQGRLSVGPVPAMEGQATPERNASEPDLAVRGTLGGLLSQLPFLRSASASSAGKVKIAGDADLARQLQKLVERYDPDWNLPFTDLFGEVIGVQIASALRKALRFGRDGSERLARDTAEFLTEESRDVIGRNELDAHLDEVDALRDRVERLHARVHHLHRRLGDGTLDGDGTQA